METLVTTKPIKVRSQEGWQNLPGSWPETAKKILASRGVISEADLHYPLDELPQPDLLKGLAKATPLLKKAIAEGWAIMIVADYDADGATSCALAMRGLQAMGAKNIDYVVPSRFDHGYGLSKGLVSELVAEKELDLIITVDNGIANLDGVLEAKNNDIKVIVTDHHLPADELPEADAIVNPNLESENFPSTNIAGVGVCFYLLLGLRQSLRADNWFESQGISEPNLLNLTDLVALGTIADVVKLDRLNRTLVTRGIARIKQGRACEGIKALLNVAGKDLNELIASDLGFSIGPRLNAAGRLEDMSLGIELLLTTNADTALQYAQQLDSLNAQRRELQNEMQTEALAMLDKLALDNNDKPLVYCLYQPSWHQGVVGLLASKIKEKFYRPTFVFAPDKEGYLKGSARSITGVHMRDVLAQLNSEFPELMCKFGGHAMAAGLTIKTVDLERFERELHTVLAKTVESDLFNESFLSDGQLMTKDINLSFADYLLNLAPWGQGFNEPRFHGEFIIDRVREVGQQLNHLRLSLQSLDGHFFQAMAFSYQRPAWLQEGGNAIMCYTLSVNNYRGQRQLQLLIDELMPVG